jgi:hypothetical protein
MKNKFTMSEKILLIFIYEKAPLMIQTGKICSPLKKGVLQIGVFSSDCPGLRPVSPLKKSLSRGGGRD